MPENPDQKEARLRDTIAGYDAVLAIIDEQDLPDEWAATLFKKGNALVLLCKGDRDDNLRAAIACYDAAREVATREMVSGIWAMMGSATGRALRELDEGWRERNLRASIECFDAALQVYTPEEWPGDHAQTQLYKADALTEIASSATPPRHKSDDFRRAIACHDSAIAIFAREGEIEDWARAQTAKARAFNRVTMQNDLGEFACALACVDEIIAALANTDFAESLRDAEKLRGEIEQAAKS